jgi:benzoyl-CoA reductase/2-hydroxyglutaryl-CoA dehydratase subunit BcrC/BadD/HgdB
MRGEEKPKISGVEWMKILLSSTAMLKEEINKYLLKIVEEAKDRDGVGDYRMRVHLSGNDFFNIELIETMESMGFAIVSDDFCTAGGYYPGFAGKSLDGLVRRYLSQSACNLASENSLKERIEFIESKVSSSNADGIVILRDRGCEVCGHQCPFIMEEFRDIPTIVLDVDSGVTEQYQTRLEAFIEAYGD